MNDNKQRYDIYINTPSTGQIMVAQTVLLESSGHLVQMAFRYTEEYRSHQCAFALDPVQLPLTDNEINLYCAGGMPGILDDYLPDDWGRRVLAQLAFYRDCHKINQHSAIEILAQLSNSRIGALQWLPYGETPSYEIGCEIKQLLAAESTAQLIDQADSFSENFDEMSLLYLANAGTGIGGARPKALIHDNNKTYLAKFNRLNSDNYNNAKVELACLQMAKAAGLNVLNGVVRHGINTRDVLLLDRFDIIINDQKPISRRHLITINALLKMSENQRDRGGVFRYDDIVNIVRNYSISIEADLTQLLRLMFFNHAVNNTDDHERNFSLINDGNGYQLAPGYDLVPSLTQGTYPIAGYQSNPWTPRPSEAANYGKIFGLPKTVVKRIAEQVITTVRQWPEWAQKNAVSESDMNKINNAICL